MHTGVQISSMKLDQTGAETKGVGAMIVRAKGIGGPKTIDYTERDMAVLVVKDGVVISGLKCIGDDRKNIYQKVK